MEGFARLLPAATKPEAIATTAVNRLFVELGRAKNADVLDRWHAGFKLLHGDLETQRQVDVVDAVDVYGLHINTKHDFLRLVLALETYYCLVLLCLGHRAATGSRSTVLRGNALFDGEALRAIGIFNYRCPEVYHWVAELLQSDEALRRLLEECDRLDLRTYDRDLVKHLFQGIFHKKLRHSLGEIYTPDWLAQLTLDDATRGDPEPGAKLYLDPTCGSGTFLVEVLRRHLAPTDGKILLRITGIDIKPISALAAKTNILLVGAAYLERLPKPYWIPVYEADCLRNVFSQHDQLSFAVDSSVPSDLLSPAMELLTRNPSVAACIDFCNAAIGSGDYDSLEVEKLAAQLVPEATRNVDYVVGNPPWVNWEYLPADYKRETAHIWQHYRLFDLKGRDSTFIKEDISALVTYVAADKYLAPGGILAFVIKQSLFKSSRQGEGFRQFNIVPTDTPLEVLKVEDLSAVHAFSGVATRAAVLLVKKGTRTTYPVEYNEWHAKTRATFREDEDLASVLADVNIERNHAFPVERDKPTSGWTSCSVASRSDISSVLGSSSYKARTGLFTGGLNAAFWMRIAERRGSHLLCRNIVERAKNKLPEVDVEIEQDLLFPFVTGSEVDLWRSRHSRYILCAHTRESRMEPLPEEVLRARFPFGWAYLESLRGPLKARKGFAGWEKSIHARYYYALQRIGDYTFAPYKVAWRFISPRFLPAVIGPVDDQFLGRTVPIPNEKVIFVGLDSADEAYYLCGVLSSTLHRSAVESFMVQTQIGPHVLEKLSIAKFDSQDEGHLAISAHCKSGHEDSSLIATAIAAIDRILSSRRANSE